MVRVQGDTSTYSTTQMIYDQFGTQCELALPFLTGIL